jgi:arylsulfatase A-like enzyme
MESADWRAIRTERYKYVVWAGEGRREMLLDLEKDQGEMRNLAGEKGMEGVLAEHRRMLREEVARVGDAFGAKLMEGIS